MPKRCINVDKARAADERLLEAVREAQKKRAYTPTDDEIRELERVRSRGSIQRYETNIESTKSGGIKMTMRPVGNERGVMMQLTIPKRGKPHVEYHEIVNGEKRAGQGSPVRPAVWELLKIDRDTAAEISKMQRTARLVAQNQQRLPRTTVEAGHERILDMLASLSRLPERNRASVAAERLGVPVRTVRHVAAQAKKRGKDRR